MKLLLFPLGLASLVACSEAAPLAEDTDTGAVIDDTAPGRLLLNELAASGDYATDDAGDPGEDWLELAAIDGPVDLGGYTLTDGSSDPWPLPAVTLDEGSYTLVWCDDDDQGVWHAPFKLSSDGEHLVLASADGPVDETTMPAAQDELTWSRDPSNAAWAYKAPTPGSANAP